ncbi:MAG: DUF397 domain-containing protein [Pseudonocardiaceae bacterium]
MPDMTRDTGWFKSSFSSADTDNCVEVRIANDHVAARDSKNSAGSVLIFPRGKWQDFIGGVKLDEFG